MNKDIAKVGAAPKKKKRIASLDKRKARVGWLFILPFVIGFVLVYLPLIVDSIRFSFMEVNLATGGGYTYTFVGFKNYQTALFEDPQFVQTLVSGITQMIFDIPAIVIFSLFMALLLNQKMVGRAAFRAIFFVPVILSTGLIGSIDMASSLTTQMGSESSIDTGSGTNVVSEIVSAVDIEKLFENMQIGTELVEYVVSMVNNIFSIVNRSGVQILIFLAGLQSISPAIYESCEIDGATAWETFWKITFPMISPMILVNSIYTVIDSFTSPSNAVMSFINTAYYKTDGRVISSAMAWMYFLIIIALVVVVGLVLSTFVFYQRRD